MDIEIFRNKLNKKAIEELSFSTINKLLESCNELDVLRFAKKLKYFADEMIKDSEERAKMVWDNMRSDYPDMNYTTGGAMYDYYKDPVYNELAEKMKERKLLLDTAVKLKDVVADSDGAIVPKVPVKGYRKDSINVNI